MAKAKSTASEIKAFIISTFRHEILARELDAQDESNPHIGGRA
jgi:hypothetical protein